MRRLLEARCSQSLTALKDLLLPDIKARVERKQEKQKERHDHHARGERTLKPNDTVCIRNFTSSQHWLPGTILCQSGPVSFVVKLTDGLVISRHQDHICLRYDKENSTFSDGTSAGGSIQVETPQETVFEKQSIQWFLQRVMDFLSQTPNPLLCPQTQLHWDPTYLCLVAHQEYSADHSVVASLLKD